MNVNCDICFLEFGSSELFFEGHQNQVVHKFHSSCIRTWIEKSSQPNCPICRSALSINTLTKFDNPNFSWKSKAWKILSQPSVALTQLEQFAPALKGTVIAGVFFGMLFQAGVFNTPMRAIGGAVLTSGLVHLFEDFLPRDTTTIRIASLEIGYPVPLPVLRIRKVRRDETIGQITSSLTMVAGVFAMGLLARNCTSGYGALASNISMAVAGSVGSVPAIILHDIFLWTVIKSTSPRPNRYNVFRLQDF